MNKLYEYDGCLLFLKNNGWKDVTEKPDRNGLVDNDSEYLSFYKNNHVGVDINVNEIVFINNDGDFLCIPTSYYALIGVLLEFRQITCGYISIGPNKED